MGKAFSVLIRPLKNYNVQSRAHKLIDDSTTVRPAPRHARENTGTCTASKNAVLGEFQKRDEQLLVKLKSVYVVSNDTTISKARTEDSKPPGTKKSLPSYRRAIQHPEIGYVEPKSVSEGKVTLLNAINFIMQHQTDPEKFTAKVIAKDHQLDEKDVVNILKHFSPFQLNLPPTDTEHPSTLRRLTQFSKGLMPKQLE